MARIRKFSRVAGTDDEDYASRLLPYRSVNGVAMGIYFNWLREGRQEITKKLLWTHVSKYFEACGLPAPKNRARVLRDIGLGDLREARSGRRRKTNGDRNDSEDVTY